MSQFRSNNGAGKDIQGKKQRKKLLADPEMTFSLTRTLVIRNFKEVTCNFTGVSQGQGPSSKLGTELFRLVCRTTWKALTHEPVPGSHPRLDGWLTSKSANFRD